MSRSIFDDALGRGDLAAQRCFLDRGGDDVGGQREIGRLELEQLLLGQCVEAFDGANILRPRCQARS